MSTIKRVFPLLSVGMVVLAACQDDYDRPTYPEPSSSREAEAPSRSSEPSLVRPHEQEFHKIAQEVKSFGGYFYDEKGNMVAYVADPSEEDRARSILEPILKSRQLNERERPGQLEIREGRYSFLELASWRDRSNDAVLDTYGVQYTDLDEAQNRLVVGVEDGRAKESVAKAMAEHDVPLEAVLFEEAGKVEELLTLRDYKRPIEGGYQIASVNGTCTLGFNAISNGAASFLTNSHCTSQFWNTDGTQIYQNNVAGGNLVGWEVSDPAPYACGVFWLFRCRWSDAAVIRKYGEVPWAYRKIARTTFWGFGAGNSGSITVDAKNPSMTIVSEYSFPKGGEMFDKMGRTTGWTYGFVNKTCVDHNKGGNRRLLCQDWIRHMHATFGDSGSPIFRWYGNTVSLAGILWGGTTQNGIPYIIMSAMWNVEKDLGPLSTF